LLAGRGDLARAAKQYSIANRIDLGETRSLRELADIMTGAERWADADAALIRLLRESPDDLSALQRLAKVRIGQRRYGEAEALLRKVLVEKTGDADAWNELGRALALSGDFAAAEAAFRRAVALSTDPAFLTNADQAGRDAASASPKPK
jgi:tetratricopeptide (TPR) repeat protein